MTAWHEHKWEHYEETQGTIHATVMLHISWMDIYKMIRALHNVIGTRHFVVKDNIPCWIFDSYDAKIYNLILRHHTFNAQVAK